MAYDIIGDIHGQFDKLEALLTQLGYRQQAGAWRHPDRTAIFVGDFIDRGPRGVETVRAVRAMVDAGTALAVMGNHELNAIAWHTPDPRDPGDYLRPRSREPWGAKNRHQHAAFLAQVEARPALHAELVDWFMTLPLYLELDGLRVVHACWHPASIEHLKPRLRDGRFLTPETLVGATTEAADPHTFRAVEALLKGVEADVPPGQRFVDKDGITRDRVRVRWWDADAGLGVPVDKPIFFGHYWMEGEPAPMAPAAACVDYSAGKGGPLVAYRWNAGEPLSAAHFVRSA